jgi:hypothetical protein
MAAAGALAACQLVTLAVLWPRPAPPTTSAGGTISALATLDKPSFPPDASELGMLNRQLLESKDGDLPPTRPSEDLVPAASPLHVFAAPTPSGLD